MEAVENLLHDIYFLYLQCNPRERRAIVCENLLSPAIFRDAIAYVLLEKYQALAVTFVYNPVVALVPLLKSTALVVDVGYSESRVVPVYAGVGITAAMTNSQICIRTIFETLRQQLQPTTTSTAPVYLDDSTLEDILVRVCFMAPEGEARKIDDVVYPINSSTKVAIPGAVRGHIGASLLVSNASVVDEDDDSKVRDIPSLILHALKKCPSTTRRELARQILVIGGGSHILGLPQAISLALNNALLHNKDKPDYQFRELQGLRGNFGSISGKPISVPSCLAWTGGSIVGSLDQYGQKITKEVYTRESKIVADWMNLKNVSLT